MVNIMLALLERERTEKYPNKVETTVSADKHGINIEISSTSAPFTPKQEKDIASCVEGIMTLTPESIGALAKELEKMRDNPNKDADFSPELENLIGSISITEEEHQANKTENLVRFFKWRDELLHDALTATEVAEDILGTSRQTPHDRVKSKTLLAIKDNGKWLFPLWQFDPQGAERVVDGLPEVLQILSPMSPYEQMSWLKQPNDALGGMEPIEALKSRKIDDVIREAKFASTY